MKEELQPQKRENGAIPTPLHERIIYQNPTRKAPEQSGIRLLPETLIPIFSALEAIEQTREEPFTPDQARKAILLSAMWEDPDHFQQASEVLQLPSEMSWILIGKAHEEVDTRTIAKEISDHKKNNDKSNSIDEDKNRKKINAEKKVVDLINEAIENNLEVALPARKLEAVHMYLAGFTHEEISQTMSVSVRTVEDQLGKARKVIEAKLLQPKGIIRVTGNKALFLAASRGKFDSAMFLNIRYSTEYNINSYKIRMIALNQDLIEKGYVLLRDVTTKQEWATVKHSKKYSEKLVRENGRIYIHHDEVRPTLASVRRTVYSEINPDENHETISIIAQTPNERQRLFRAVKNGKLNGILTRKGWSVNRHEAEVLLKKTRNNSL